MNTETSTPKQWVLVGAVAALVGLLAYRYSMTAWHLAYGWSIMIGILTFIGASLIFYRPREVVLAIRSALRAFFRAYEKWRADGAARKVARDEESLRRSRNRAFQRALMYKRLTVRAELISEAWYWALLISWGFGIAYGFASIHFPMWPLFWHAVLISSAVLTLFLRVGVWMAAISMTEADLKAGGEQQLPWGCVSEIVHDKGRLEHRRRCKETVRYARNAFLCANPIGACLCLVGGMCTLLVVFVGCVVPMLFKWLIAKTPAFLVAMQRFVVMLVEGLAVFMVTLFCKLNTTARAAIFTCSSVGFTAGIVAERFGVYREAPLICLAAGFTFGMVEHWLYRQFESRMHGFLSRRVRTRGGYC